MRGRHGLSGRACAEGPTRRPGIGAAVPSSSRRRPCGSSPVSGDAGGPPRAAGSLHGPVRGQADDWARRSESERLAGAMSAEPIPEVASERPAILSSQVLQRARYALGVAVLALLYYGSAKVGYLLD